MDAPLHFRVETYEDRGNHPWYRHYHGTAPPPLHKMKALLSGSPSFHLL
jgi:hypothetical protein